MAYKIQKPCKICGKMFTPCADCENDKTMFRWKRVACSPECAKEYFARIEASRTPKIINADVQAETTNSKPNSRMLDDATYETKSKKIRKKNYVENKESEQID